MLINYYIYIYIYMNVTQNLCFACSDVTAKNAFRDRGCGGHEGIKVSQRKLKEHSFNCSYARRRREIATKQRFIIQNDPGQYFERTKEAEHLCR